MLRILVATTDNEPGVLDRVASTFRRRGFNIHSLTVSPTPDSSISRMTLVTDLDDRSARIAKAFLQRLVNIHCVTDLTDSSAVVRDLALVRVRATPETRGPIFQLAQVFQAEVVDVTPGAMVLSACGSPDRIDALVESLRPYGLLELGRTGAVAMQRGAAQPAAQPLSDDDDDASAVCF
jgi:acetolactate synthase-1/3 small subunit